MTRASALAALLAAASVATSTPSPTRADDSASPSFDAHVAPVLKRYCVGCHNDQELEGNFSLEGPDAWTEGTSKGPLVRPGDAGQSLLIRLMIGQAKPAMPPKGEPRPSEAEIAQIRTWIDAGAKRPDAAPADRLALAVPKIVPKTAVRPITALDLSRDGRHRAEARYGEVALFSAGVDIPVRKLSDFPGKVTAVHFANDDRWLVVASGVTGLGGVASIWDTADGHLVRRFDGHKDLLFDAELSPDGKTLATCGYDRTIQLWDAATGQNLRILTGHNGAVYDVAFSPDGRFLLSASGDDTCKVWRVADGARLDTLPQPLKEAYACTWSPDGRTMVAVGADNSIRVWDFIARDEPKINPMTLARFAHEGPIHHVRFTPDGSRLVTTAGDRTVKVWDVHDFTEIQLRDHEPDIITALAVAADGRSIRVGRIDGSSTTYNLPAAPDRAAQTKAATIESNATSSPTVAGPAATVSEAEPNNDPARATEVPAPATITGTIGMPGDVDLFRWRAKAGEEWVVEVNAARSKSKLDSFVEVLDEKGGRVERVLLQATRDSYFTFRGKNDSIAADFRLFNWDEMRLNELLYANGEIVKLWLYPRGPDSGFLVYPGEGKRWGYYDTTPLAHALGEPCYVVEPHPPGTPLIPNGLPVFSLGYENDDDSRREFGKDSRLTFKAPADGVYLVKLRDVRGSGGTDHGYTLSLRPRRPDFQVSLAAVKAAVVPGAGQEFKVSARRVDDFDGPIRVELTGLPTGFHAQPVVIEPGQVDALGLVEADGDAPMPPAADPAGYAATATAMIDGREQTQAVRLPGTLKLAPKAPLRVVVGPVDGPAPEPGKPFEVDIHPGQTITLKVRVDRNGVTGPILFGNEGCGRNLPFGVYVDNIGLNGLMITPDQSERTFAVTADRVAAHQDRPFHLTTASGGGQSSPVVILHVR